MLDALTALGFDAEADAFWQFLKRVCRRADRRHLQIMYGVDGRRDLPEVLLEHLAGYGGAHPVRVGNGAPNHVIEPGAPSAARVVYDHFGGVDVFPDISSKMMDAVDKALK